MQVFLNCVVLYFSRCYLSTDPHFRCMYMFSFVHLMCTYCMHPYVCVCLPAWLHGKSYSFAEPLQTISKHTFLQIVTFKNLFNRWINTFDNQSRFWIKQFVPVFSNQQPFCGIIISKYTYTNSANLQSTERVITAHYYFYYGFLVPSYSNGNIETLSRQLFILFLHGSLGAVMDGVVFLLLHVNKRGHGRFL